MNSSYDLTRSPFIPYPETDATLHAGKFNKHIDLWDAVEDQDYFSMEAFQHVLAQLGDLTRTPSDLDTPNYTIMRKYKTHEIRR